MENLLLYQPRTTHLAGVKSGTHSRASYTTCNAGGHTRSITTESQQTTRTQAQAPPLEPVQHQIFAPKRPRQPAPSPSQESDFPPQGTTTACHQISLSYGPKILGNPAQPPNRLRPAVYKALALSDVTPGTLCPAPRNNQTPPSAIEFSLLHPSTQLQRSPKEAWRWPRRAAPPTSATKILRYGQPSSSSCKQSQNCAKIGRRPVPPSPLQGRRHLAL